MNNLDLTVLRALARLSRMRKAVDGEALALRAGVAMEEVRAALGRLSRAGLVQRAPEPRLTLSGLALAVASGEGRAPANREAMAVRPAAGRRAA